MNIHLKFIIFTFASIFLAGEYVQAQTMKASYATVKSGKTVIYTQGFNGSNFDGNVREIPLSNSDRIRGWSWDGTTASYAAVKSGKTVIYIQGFDGVKFAGNAREIPLSNSDRIRGWSWDGTTASYAAVKSGKTVIYIQGFDGVKFTRNAREIPLSNSDRIRGWSWDGTTASYAALKSGKTVIYKQGFNGIKFGGNAREIPISNSDRIRGWNWGKQIAALAAVKNRKPVTPGRVRGTKLVGKLRKQPPFRAAKNHGQQRVKDNATNPLKNTGKRTISNQSRHSKNPVSYRNFDDDVQTNPYPFDNGIRKNVELPFENGVVQYYKIMEGTKAEYVAEGSDGNILRWANSGKDDQLWLIYPDESPVDGSKKYRIQNKGSHQFMTVTPNGNVHRWATEKNNDSQLFEFKTAERGFSIKEGTKNEVIGVGSNGNILRWEHYSGKEQQFIPIPYPFPTMGLHPQKMKIMVGQKAYMPGKIPTPPRVKDFSWPQNGKYYFISESVLPGTHVNDPLYDDKIAQIHKNNSPYYYLVREQYYKPIQTILQANSNVKKVKKDALTLNEQQINSVTETLGWAIDASAGVTAGVGVPGAGASASAGLSAGLSHSTETREETRHTKETNHMENLSISFKSPPERLNVVVWYLMDRFTLYNYKGRVVPGKQWEVENRNFVETYPYTPWDGAMSSTK